MLYVVLAIILPTIQAKNLRSRHCLGCHNLVITTSMKVFIQKNIAVLGNNYVQLLLSDKDMEILGLESVYSLKKQYKGNI